MNFVTARRSITGGTADAIARSVEEAIAGGRLAGDDALPPVRALADELGVSPTTVAAAYRMLRQRGLVVGQGRRGTRLARREHEPSRAAFALPSGEGNLVGGNPDPLLLPDLEPLLRRVPMPRELYGAPTVTDELAKAGRRLLQGEGLDVAAMSVVSGAMDGIERVLATHLRPGDKVAVEDPAFAGILDLLGAMSLVPVPFDIDDEGPDPESFERTLASGVKAVVVTPRAQNPTGAALTAPRAALLRKSLARHADVLLVEDDHAGSVAGAPLVTLGARTRHAYIRSMAKALGPDLRVALLVGTPDVVARVERRQVVGLRWVSRLLQRLVAAALEDRTVQAAVARAAKEYTKRRVALVNALAERGVTASGRSGLNVWIPVREEAASVQALAAAGWFVAPGERFRLRSGPGLRVTTAALRVEDAARVADAIARAVRPAASTA